MEEITRDNYRDVDVNGLALNPSFGSLTFNASAGNLDKLRSWLQEFEELDYRSEVPANIANDIDQRINQLIEHLNWLRNFDIAASANAKGEHDDYEARIGNFYNDVFNSLIVNHLDFLRQEAALKSGDKKELQKQQKDIIQLKKEYEEINKQLSNQLKKLVEKENAIESKSGEVAAAVFGKHFESQAAEYEGKAKKWGSTRDRFFKWLLGIIIANFAVYFYLFIASKVEWKMLPGFPPKELFTLEYGIAKLALLIVLSYAIGFASKNYSVNSHLETINKHRKNVAETLKDFLNSKPEQEDRSALVRAGADAMFKNSSTGYIKKDGGPTDNEPMGVGGVINTIIGNKK